jgi:molecular chaperone GrpE
MTRDKNEDKEKNPDACNGAVPGETSTDDIEQEIEETRKKAEEYLASLQRTQADFVNYKRRTEQERQEFAAFANATLLKSILPVADDLERALENVPEDIEDHEWVEGIRLVERKFKSSLEGCGVKPVLALGMEFDPNFHEALRQDAGPEGMVVGEFQKGYLLNDKLLRPARVTVGNGEDKDNKEEE